MSNSEPVVAVDVDGVALVWQNGHLTGDEELKNRALLSSLLGEEVSLLWGTPPVKANLSPDENEHYDYVGIAAALVATNPGRAVLTEFPLQVEEYLTKWDVPSSPEEIVVY